MGGSGDEDEYDEHVAEKVSPVSVIRCNMLIGE